MCRNWKKMADLGLAVLLGCAMPVSTMLAAEDDAGTEVSSVSDNDVLQEEGNTPDDGNISDGENTSDNAGGGDILDDGNAGGEADQDGIGADAGNAEDEDAIMETAPAVRQKAAAKGAEMPQAVDGPEITIKGNGKNLTCELGGTITYEYINKNVGSFAFQVTANHASTVSWYLDKVTNMNQGPKSEEDLKELWTPLSSEQTIQLHNDGAYVFYVKAEGAEGQISYARSGGIVRDTQAPTVTGIEDGKSYPAGTAFQIEDANLESVTINGKPVALSPDGKYQVAADDISCVIKAKDKAGNETDCSITVLENGTLETGNVIAGNGIYDLQAGTKYHLAAGKWKVSGDRCVYQGDSDLYVKENGKYGFWKYFYK